MASAAYKGYVKRAMAGLLALAVAPPAVLAESKFLSLRSMLMFLLRGKCLMVRPSPVGKVLMNLT